MYSWRVTRKSVLWITIMLMIGLSVASVGVSRARAQENGTRVKVEPSNVTIGEEGEPYPIGEQFTVNVTLYDVAGLYGWEFKLFWDNTVLSAIDHIVHTPPAWEDYNAYPVGPGIQNDYNDTHSRYYMGLVPLLAPAPTFNGTTLLVTLTFNVTAGGSSTLDLQEIKLSDYDVEPIPHQAFDGTVTVIPEFPASVILPLFLVATLVAIILGKTVWSRKRGSLSVAKPNT